MTKIYFLKALELEGCNQGLSRATLPPESLGENLFLASPSCCQMAVGVPCLGAMLLQSPPVFTLPPPLWSEYLILSPLSLIRIHVMIFSTHQIIQNNLLISKSLIYSYLEKFTPGSPFSPLHTGNKIPQKPRN